jgi:DNA-binding CsgD family transcriptional regulator
MFQTNTVLLRNIQLKRASEPFRATDHIVNAISAGGNVTTETTRPGLLLLDSSENLVASNEEGIQILTFPVRPDKMRRSGALLRERIHSFLRHLQSLNGKDTESSHEFRSGKRTYTCRFFSLKSYGKGVPVPSVHVLVFERRTNPANSISEACGRFGLTQREQETIQLLLEGLTSKEIAVRMNISPNTVKSFLRLVMVKMGVSTRSAVVGMVLGTTEGMTDRGKTTSE